LNSSPTIREASDLPVTRVEPVVGFENKPTTLSAPFRVN
jgi:hypothetical protein